MERWFPPAASPGTGRRKATPAAAPGQVAKHTGVREKIYNIHPRPFQPVSRRSYFSHVHCNKTICQMLWLPQAITAAVAS